MLKEKRSLVKESKCLKGEKELKNLGFLKIRMRYWIKLDSLEKLFMMSMFMITKIFYLLIKIVD